MESIPRTAPIRVRIEPVGLAPAPESSRGRAPGTRRRHRGLRLPER
jgi:hypothetical protein